MNRSEKRSKKNLLGIYKRCIDACSFRNEFNNKMKDPNGHFKRIIQDRMNKLSSNLN